MNFELDFEVELNRGMKGIVGGNRRRGDRRRDWAEALQHREGPPQKRKERQQESKNLLAPFHFCYLPALNTSLCLQFSIWLNKKGHWGLKTPSWTYYKNTLFWDRKTHPKFQRLKIQCKYINHFKPRIIITLTFTGHPYRNGSRPLRDKKPVSLGFAQKIKMKRYEFH